MLQKTLRKSYTFKGKGLHTGTFSRIVVSPAPENSGIIFRNITQGVTIPANAFMVSDTSRSTTLSKDGCRIHTVEHILSALTGLGVDNAVIEFDGIEVPILDGSASKDIAAITVDGLQEQKAERKYIELKEEVFVSNEKTGSWVRLTPADKMSISLTVDFGSKVLGVQKAEWDEQTDYATQIGICRTFVFFHEIEYLFANNLIKGGDVDNAIVIVEHPVTEEQLDRMAAAMNLPKIKVESNGYLNNLKLHFPDECGRHKLLDLLGDIRLCGGYVKAKIEAFKPGHAINTEAAKAVLEQLAKN